MLPRPARLTLADSRLLKQDDQLASIALRGNTQADLRHLVASLNSCTSSLLCLSSSSSSTVATLLSGWSVLLPRFASRMAEHMDLASQMVTVAQLPSLGLGDAAEETQEAILRLSELVGRA